MAACLGPVKTYHRDTYSAIDPTLPHLSTKGQNIVISGGGTGIGRETARSFAKSGASTIHILGRRENKLLETKQIVEKDYPNTQVYTYITDIVKRDELDAAFQAISSTVGLINVLIANAAYMADYKPFAEADPKEWFNCFEVNVRGSFNFVTAFLPFAAQDATIINISSGIVSLPLIPFESAYHASKIAEAKFYEYVACEHPNFVVINLHPATFDSEMSAKTPVDTPGFANDEAALPGDATVWAVSEEAKFLNEKFIWAHWDVDELKALSHDIETTNILTVGLLGAQ
ncbi:NAD(P)-binding protein [Hyaloscypha variabilis F]|uniref:NAD(P)-binding protein n=1 Tax=Hyaloscypha variabilis (strain UAMH 11265 / GT02V1 / F) TaxID=1149755 RepID=A0A2J6QRT5_HYAVF|nr:NAD(P)-binding protein [Hyaloscypha variabilis F]